MDSTLWLAALGVIVLITVMKGVRTVPQQQAWIVESLGKFDRALEPGINFLIPFIQSVAYRHSLKEAAVEVPEQAGITRDNVTLILDGILYVRIVDPVAASYGVNNPVNAVMQLAQTTMRSEIGKLTLDKTFEERETLNANIVAAINQAAQNWGIQCMRYEIKNITPPSSALKAMELQMAADRQKRATILESEGKRQAQINVAEGAKQETILKAEGQQQQTILNAEARKTEIVLQSEAAQIDQVNRANGEAQAIVAVATATAEGIAKVAESILKQGGAEAVSLKIAEQYVDAFKGLARSSTTVLMPANPGDVGGMVAQALTVFDSIRSKTAAAGKSPWAGA
ncbi:MAG: paraslipin [Alphaproteobacteria bacterium]|nr:paraslipin [Alphaproteobacteria bacterium]